MTFDEGAVRLGGALDPDCMHPEAFGCVDVEPVVIEEQHFFGEAGERAGDLCECLAIRFDPPG